MPGAGQDPDRLPKAVEKIEETQKKLEEQVGDCLVRRAEVMRVVAAVADPAVQEVLRRRYILGESYAEIADAMGVVLRRVYQIHRAGVLALPLGRPEQNAYCRGEKFSRKFIVFNNLK